MIWYDTIWYDIILYYIISYYIILYYIILYYIILYYIIYIYIIYMYTHMRPHIYIYIYIYICMYIYTYIIYCISYGQNSPLLGSLRIVSASARWEWEKMPWSRCPSRWPSTPGHLGDVGTWCPGALQRERNHRENHRKSGKNHRKSGKNHRNSGEKHRKWRPSNQTWLAGTNPINGDFLMGKSSINEGVAVATFYYRKLEMLQTATALDRPRLAEDDLWRFPRQNR